MEQYFLDLINGNVTQLPPTNTTFHLPQTLRQSDTYVSWVNWDVMQQQQQVISSIGDTVVPLVVRGSHSSSTSPRSNCLLESLSKAMWGTEIYASLLLPNLINEISQNNSYYRALVARPEDLATHMKEAMEGASLRFFHILALSNFLIRPIFVYAPPELTLLHGAGHGGVCASFAPTRRGPSLCQSPPLALAISPAPSLTYVPLVPFEGSTVTWPVLPPAYNDTLINGQTIQSYLPSDVPVIYPPLQIILSDPNKIVQYANARVSWGKQHPSQYISSLRQLKAKYDLVWQIEMGGKEQRFICYNVGDDPVALAKKFVSVEKLPDYFFGKVLSFIQLQIENAKRDPNMNHIFSPNRKKAPPSKYFPYMGDMLSYSTAKFPQILNKLLEFNNTLKADQKTAFLSISSSEIEIIKEMVEILEQQNNLSPQHYLILEKLLDWPCSNLFPVLDIIRMVADNPNSVNYLKTHPSILHKILSIGKAQSCLPTNMFLILKSIVNILRRDSERTIVRLLYSDIIQVLDAASYMENNSVHNCLSSAMLNLTLLTTELDQSKQVWLSILIRILLNTTDSEISHRCLLAIGSLLYKVQSLYGTVEQDDSFHGVLVKYQNSSDSKVSEYVKDLQNFVQTVSYNNNKTTVK